MNKQEAMINARGVRSLCLSSKLGPHNVWRFVTLGISTLQLDTKIKKELTMCQTFLQLLESAIAPPMFATAKKESCGDPKCPNQEA